MALELDPRQRAMLKAMGVHVWLPGVTFVPPVQVTPVAPTQPRAAAALPPAPAPVVASPLVSVSVPAAGLDWAALADTVASCRACGLCAGRKHATLLPLPATSRGSCDWMVLGDAPDADEDRTGSPFAGTDGVLLGNMLAALGVQRVNFTGPAETAALAALPPAARAYVTHVVKCRPAHGQIPQAADLAQCAAYLQQEIALVQPKIILALGRFAQQLVLSADPALALQPLGKVRGKVHRYHGVDVVLSYHPKALMRNSADKGKAWADLCLAAQTLAGPR